MRPGKLPKLLDEKLLGQKLPGRPEERAAFLIMLEKIRQHPAGGEEFIRQNAKSLLAEAESLLSEKAMLRQYRLTNS